MTQASELIAQQMANANNVRKIWGDVIINVKEAPYNAKGDWNGTSGTNDTIAIQKAINYANSIGKHDIWMPPGTYKYTTLSNTGSITFYGDYVNLVGDTFLEVVSFHSMVDRIDNIVAGAGSSNTEIVDARLPATGSAYPTLKTRLDTENANVVTSVNNEQAARIAADAAHAANPTAHNATAIVFTPGGSGISATNVDGAIKEIDTLLDALQSGDSSAAANAARVSTPYGVTFDTLKDRVDHTDAEAIALKADVTQRGINVIYPPAPLVAAVGNGTTDDSAAITAILALGDIWIPFGFTFLIGNVDVNGRKIFGGGTIKKKSASESAFHIKGSGTVISGLTFQAENTSGQPQTDIKLGDGSKNIRIEGCNFTSPIYSAVAAAVDTGSGGAAYTTRVSGVMITNNVIRKLDSVTVGYARPLFMHSVDNLTIQGNLIRDTDYDAIRLRENDGFVLIDGNQFINIGDPAWPDSQTRDAIDTYWSGANLTITNNIVRKTACFGFDIKGYAADGSYGSNKVIIANNQIYQCRYSGISIAGDANYDGAGNYKSIYGVNISNNVIQECNQNNITGTGSVGDGGILLSKLFNGVTISDNYIAFNYGRGIYAHNEDAGKAMGKNLIIESNMCVNNGQSTLTGTGNGGAGIVVFGIERVIMTQNICDNDTTLPNPYQQGGIYHASVEGAYTPAKLSIITDNICTNNVADQFLMNSNNNRLNAIAIFERNVQIGAQSSFRGSWQYTKNIFFGSVPATSAEGTINVGDVTFNINLTDARNISHWIHQGSNVWKAFGSGFGTTAARPTLTANDAGYSYMDTTIAKMILWNGTTWLV